MLCDVSRYLWLISQWCQWLSICSCSMSISVYRYVIWCSILSCDMMWYDVTLLLQLHDIEYYVDYQTTTYLLLYNISISANTLTGWLQRSILRESKRTCWGSETASRQRRWHWSRRQRKLHHHGMILRIVRYRIDNILGAEVIKRFVYTALRLRIW